MSVASYWELAIKIARGRLRLDRELRGEIERNSFQLIPIVEDDAAEAAALPPLHLDPFDRMIVAQARRRNLVVVTADPQVAAYDVAILAT